MPRRMHLAFNLSYTHVNGRWHLPGAWDERTFPDPTLFEDAARLFERGLLDLLFSGDGTGVPNTWGGQRDGAVEWGVMYPRVDMCPVMVAAARVTEHIGFALTYNFGYMVCWPPRSTTTPSPAHRRRSPIFSRSGSRPPAAAVAS